MTKKTKLMVIIGGAAVAVLALGLGLGFGLEADSDYDIALNACVKAEDADALELDKIACTNAKKDLSNEDKTKVEEEVKTKIAEATKAALEAVEEAKKNAT